MSADSMISQADFQTLSHILKKNIGMNLLEDKIYLLSSRLAPIKMRYSIKNFSELSYLLSTNSVAGLLDDVINAMTINETYFFRDTKSFQDLRNTILPHIQNQLSNRQIIRVWSAASSTGQEAYSFAIEAIENKLTKPAFEYEILGTDICTRVINQAEKGVYNQLEIQRGLPALMLVKYFSQIDSSQWQINDQVRKLVNFRKHNLLHDLQENNNFDLILCRNVLIYFDNQTKFEILKKLEKKLAPKGILLIASTDSIDITNTNLVPFQGVAGAFTKVI